MTSDPQDPYVPLSEEDVSRVYLEVLKQPRPGRDSVIEAGVSESIVDRASALLHSRGLIDASDPQLWDVPAPDIALPAWAADVERRARAWRATASELHQMYVAARSITPVESPNRDLSSLTDIASATATIAAGARTSIVAMRANSRRTLQVLLDPYQTHKEPFLSAAGHPIEVRAVYDAAILEVDGTSEALSDRVIGGEQVRLAPFVPFSAIIVDNLTAVVEFSNIEPSGAGSMALNSRPFVRALTSLADAWFASGVALPGDHEAHRPAGRTSRDDLILSMLASGASDSTITRRLRISQRTVERRIRHLMQMLGVETRFQAGVEAVRQGLV